MLFLVDNTRKIIFGWSAKCGCGHIKKIFWFMQTKKIDNPIHTWRDSSYLPHNITEYKLIIIGRNPYKRIVSGFLNKYNKNGEFRHLWKHDTITFSKFVDTLLNNQDGMIDYHHFTPQTTENFNINMIIHAKSIVVYDIENINYEYIESLYNTKIPDELMNFKGKNERKHKHNNILFEENVSDLDMDLYYQYNIPIQNFYTEDIKKKVYSYYKQDFGFFKSRGFNYQDFFVPTNKNFLFSSVGDNTSFDELYVGNNMNYDIYAIYYGDNEDNYNKYKSKLKFIEKRKGSKFQNFKYFYETYPEIINKYEYFFILDDDIIIDVTNINSMFEIAKKYNLSICGPSFLDLSKISFPMTIQNPARLLTYTSFIEVNVPLFNKTALDNLMKYLDYSLIGWGIDFLMIWCNGIHKKTDYAIIHSVSCINPHDADKKDKNKGRELYLIPNSHNRENIWHEYADKIGCPRRLEIVEYASITREKNV